MSKQTPSTSARRSFLTRLNSGAASLAAIALGGVAVAQVKSAPAKRFEPAHHDKDNWLDELPGQHRLFVDTTTAEGFRDGLLFARNFIAANGTDYGLDSKDLAVVVVARHQSTSFGFNNEMWAKYGTHFAADLPPAQAATPHPTNPGAATIDSLAGLGVQFPVCSMAALRIADTIARATNGNTDAIFTELTTHLIANGRMVPAGIVAVARAQEKGYSLARA